MISLRYEWHQAFLSGVTCTPVLEMLRLADELGFGVHAAEDSHIGDCTIFTVTEYFDTSKLPSHIVVIP